MELQDPIRQDDHCRVCGNAPTETVLRLTPTPPEDSFVPQERLGILQDVYPLELALCTSCGYVHLPHVLNPQVSYQEYIYETRTTVGLSDHYRDYASKLVTDLQLGPDALVVDIGSNDGTMLEAFSERNVRSLGVEPNPTIASVANDRGRQTICGYFTPETARGIVERHGRASAVTANYVYANVDDLYAFTSGVIELLDSGGVFVIQTGYHPDQMNRMMFDYIYHEHFSYFTVKALVYLLDRCGLELIHVEREPHKGGSIRVYAQRKEGVRPVDVSVAAFLDEEERAGIHECAIYERFSEQIDSARAELSGTLRSHQSKGLRIVGYGASHSTTTLIYHFGLGDVLDYLVDDNPLKQGLYSPGLHLPVYDPGKLHDEDRVCAVVVAWQHADSIIARNRESLVGRQIVVPLPQLRVVDC